MRFLTSKPILMSIWFKSASSCWFSRISVTTCWRSFSISTANTKLLQLLLLLLPGNNTAAAAAIRLNTNTLLDLLFGLLLLLLLPAILLLQTLVNEASPFLQQKLQLQLLLPLQGAAEKSGPLNFFAVFSATVWDFNMMKLHYLYSKTKLTWLHIQLPLLLLQLFNKLNN